jgi:hypothetical protein
MENKIDIKKIVGNGNMAKLSHVVAGVLYYTVQTEDGVYQFPVKAFNMESGAFFKLNANTQASPEVTMQYVPVEKQMFTMADDVGPTTFVAEVKAMELMRWIRKSIESGELGRIV